MKEFTVEQKVRDYYERELIPCIDVKNSVINNLDSTKKAPVRWGRRVVALVCIFMMIVTTGLAVSNKLSFYDKDGNLAWETEVQLGSTEEDILRSALYSNLKSLDIELGKAVLGHIKVEGFENGITALHTRQIQPNSLEEVAEIVGEQYNITSLLELLPNTDDFLSANVRYNPQWENFETIKQELIEDAYKDDEEFHYVYLDETSIVDNIELQFDDYEVELSEVWNNIPETGIFDRNENTTIQSIMLDSVEAIYLNSPNYKFLSWVKEVNGSYQMIEINSRTMGIDELIDIARHIDKHYTIK